MVGKGEPAVSALRSGTSGVLFSVKWKTEPLLSSKVLLFGEQLRSARSSRNRHDESAPGWGTVSGPMPGGGNHRGSIFRLHVGTALLSVAEWPEEIRQSWGVRGSASSEVKRWESRSKQRQLADRLGLAEQAIQRYEAGDYVVASFARLVEMADALNLAIHYDVRLASAG